MIRRSLVPSLALSLAVCGLALLALPALADPPPQAQAPAGTQAPKKKRAPIGRLIYDENADGEKQIGAAVAKARAEGKRVLVVFGGNWCKWCLALHDLIEKDEEVKRVLDEEYVMVLVDSDKNAHLDAVYDGPFKNGFPVLVVLDGDGRRVHTQETGSLEKADKTVAHDRQKVLAFLRAFAAPGQGPASQPGKKG